MRCGVQAEWQYFQPQVERQLQGAAPLDIDKAITLELLFEILFQPFNLRSFFPITIPGRAVNNFTLTFSPVRSITILETPA